MVDYKANPPLALERLKEIMEEIASGVSAEEVGENVPLLYNTRHEIQNFIKGRILANFENNIDSFWKVMEVEKKLKCMKVMEEHSPNTEAWRPTTGVLDVNGNQAEMLLRTKSGLQTRIANMRNESTTLRRQIEDFTKALKNQMEDINKLSPTLGEQKKVEILK